MADSTRKMYVFVNDTTSECMDIYQSEAVEGKEIGLYPSIHYGPNQSWFLEADQIVSALDPGLCLGVEFKTSPVVRLLKRSRPNTRWVIVGKFISLESRRNLYLSCQGSRVVVQDKADASASWSLVPIRNSAHQPKPATSCHLTYGPLPEADLEEHWVLECTVRVLESAPCTYFCVVGWAPGGYSGIQQVDDCKRVAIFSMWNGAAGKVSELDHGPGVEVSRFGGEGTGLKSMKELDWKENQDITFIVEGTRQSQRMSELFLGCCSRSGKDTWICKCWFKVDGKKYFMASFQRESRQRPLSPNGFYSFVEDWDRSEGAKGHELQRRAKFQNARFCSRRGDDVACANAKFTKVENGSDAFAKDKARGGTAKSENCFFLATGGDDCGESKGEKEDGDIVRNGVIFSCSPCRQ